MRVCVCVWWLGGLVVVHHQGFQMLVDVDDGWGGAAREVIELIRDDFPRTPLLTFALGHPRRSRTPVRSDHPRRGGTAASTVHSPHSPAPDIHGSNDRLSG